MDDDIQDIMDEFYDELVGEGTLAEPENIENIIKLKLAYYFKAGQIEGMRNLREHGGL